MEKIEIKAGENTHEIIVREGTAPENFKVRNGINISGTIGLPLAHLEKDSLTMISEDVPEDIKDVIGESYLSIDRHSMEILFVENAGKPYESRYSGALKINPDFEKWGINTDKDYTPIQLANFIKMNRSAFESNSVAMKLVSELMNFEAKINKEVEAKADERANRKILMAQTVITNLPEGFNLKLPIFKGSEAVVFEVEIAIVPVGLACRLVSPEVNDVISGTKNEVIDDIKNAIIEMHPNLRIFEI